RHHVLPHHRAPPPARGHRRRRHRGDRARLPARQVRARTPGDSRLVLAFRRSGVDVRLPAGLPHEHALSRGMKRYVIVWLCLLTIVALEVAVALSHPPAGWLLAGRSEEHTSELQSRSDLVCRLLLEKKKK